MELEKIKTVATTITATLEEEGIMSLEELKDLTNLEENDVLLALDWLHGEERVELLPTGKVVSVMLVF
ncbi:MAG: winged helix-turn-helix domain-containing protein [Prolixibacteraceae bacterium]|jgi:hypothetical protein|nr:winged helix-turn-helix domain-containing protein [Prolixibacteraceae bacterium]